MNDFTAQQLIMRAVALLFIAGVHGFTVAATAKALGDRNPQYDGRLTANPFRQLDLLGRIGLVFFSLGWIKPVAIAPGALRFGRLGLVIVVVAGIAATIVAALLARLLRVPSVTFLPDTLALPAFGLINVAADLSVWFALFNLQVLLIWLSGPKPQAL
jgi:hypothetical protein